MAREQFDLAGRAAGGPAQLKVATAVGDGDTTLNVSGIELGDVVVALVEFYSPDEAVNMAVAAVSGGNVTGNGTVTTTGSALPTDHSVLVLYYDFD